MSNSTISESYDVEISPSIWGFSFSLLKEISSTPARCDLTHDCQVREYHDLCAVTSGVEECSCDPILVGYAHATKESGTSISSLLIKLTESHTSRSRTI
jgi:hypothetical protein